MSLHVIPRFEVIDESDDWLVVDKPAPLIVHPANRKPEPTLLGGIEYLLAYEIENGARPAIVNRLDRDTSGLVVVAKNREAARELGMLFQERGVTKEYLAVIHGWPVTDAWNCAEPILRAGEIGPSAIWVRQIVHPSGKDCLTSFEVIRRFEHDGRPFALVRCLPETGRMHQIRVHLAHCGHPVVGDKIYSGDGAEYLRWMADGWTPALQEALLLPRHALHASRLQVTWRGLAMDWHAPLAADLQCFVDGEEVPAHPDAILWSRHD